MGWWRTHWFFLLPLGLCFGLGGILLIVGVVGISLVPSQYFVTSAGFVGVGAVLTGLGVAIFRSLRLSRRVTELMARPDSPKPADPADHGRPP